MEEEDSDIDLPNPPPDILASENPKTLNVLSPESKQKYQHQYDNFKSWMRHSNISTISESTLLEYFAYNSTKFKPSTLWPQYSMLRATIAIYDNIQINKFRKLIAFIKQRSNGYIPNKSKTLTNAQINKFILMAADDKYLMIKVALIMGMAGACRGIELKNMTLDDINDKGSIMIVNIQDSKTKKERIFTIAPGKIKGVNLLEVVRKYIALRPFNTPHRRLFIFYSLNKCTVQPVGINTISKIPAAIASFLGLPEPKEFTGHCLRRSSASLLEYTGGNILSLKCYGGCSFPNTAASHIENLIEEDTDLRLDKSSVNNGSNNLPISNIENEEIKKVLPSVKVLVKTDMSVTLEELKVQCRTCSKDSNSIQINLTEPDKVNLLRLLDKLLGFPVRLSANGSFNICYSCESTLKKILKFSEKCVYTHKKYLYELDQKKSSNMRSQPINTITPLKRKSVTVPSIPLHPKLPRLSAINPLSNDSTLSSSAKSVEATDPLALTQTDSKTPNKLIIVNNSVAQTPIFKKPFIRLLKTFELNNPEVQPKPINSPPNSALSVPFPQTRLPKYCVQDAPSSPQRPKKPLSNCVVVHTDHAYIKRKHPRVYQRAQFEQIPASVVVEAIEEFKAVVDSKMVKCIFCSCSAESIALLTGHMQRKHAAQYPQWCYTCNKIVDNMAEHKKQRACEKLFSCKFCCAIFRESITLLHHMEFHNKAHFHPELCLLSDNPEVQQTDVPELVHVMPDVKVSKLSNKTVVESAKTRGKFRINMKSTDIDHLKSSEINESEDSLMIDPMKIKQEHVEDKNLVLLTNYHQEIQIKEEPTLDEIIEEPRPIQEKETSRVMR